MRLSHPSSSAILAEESSFFFFLIKITNTFWGSVRTRVGCSFLTVWVICGCALSLWYCYVTTWKQNAVVSQSECTASRFIASPNTDWGSAGRFIMQGCHFGPSIQDWTNNESFVLQLERINEVLLNKDVSYSPSHSSTMQKQYWLALLVQGCRPCIIAVTATVSHPKIW